MPAENAELYKYSSREVPSARNYRSSEPQRLLFPTAWTETKTNEMQLNHHQPTVFLPAAEVGSPLDHEHATR